MLKRLKQFGVSILPALKGIVRIFGYQQETPFSCIDSTNVWPVNTSDGRRVSAARPPLVAYYAPGIAGTPCNLACAVNGDGAFVPLTTYVTARNGVLYRWTGTGYVEIDSGFTPPLITTGRPVYSAAFLLQVVIANDGVPLVYNHASQGVTPGQRLTQLVASIGEVPLNSKCVAAWQGCVWFADRHILTCSRTGDITDYNVAALPEDEGGAFTTAGAEEGRIGERICAIMPHTGDSMMIGCLNSMYVLHGHPRRGGILEVRSTEVGPLGQGAWCVVPDGRMFALTKAGVVTIDPNNATVAPLSREIIPDELFGLEFDPDNCVVSLAYDSRWNGIHITIRGTNEQAWFYDLKEGGFHRETFADYPYLLMGFPDLDSDATSGVLFFGDGYGGVARFDVDGAEEFDYQQFIGPIKIAANSTYKSKCLSVKVMFGMPTALTGSVSAWFGQDGEECYQNAIHNRVAHKATSTFQYLKDNGSSFRPLQSGAAMLLEITGEDGPMNFEGADCDFEDAGRQKGLRNWSIQPEVSAGPDQAVEFV